jgi:hypothetical protein
MLVVVVYVCVSGTDDAFGWGGRLDVTKVEEITVDGFC